MSMRDQQRMWEIAGRYSAVGIEIAISLVLPTLVGLWADRRWGTQPWLMLLGLFIGLGAASRAVLQIVKLARRDEQRRNERRRDDRGGNRRAPPF